MEQLCTASTSSAALDSATPVAQGQKWKCAIREETKESEEPCGYIRIDLGQGRQKSIISAMSLYTEEESADIDLLVGGDIESHDPPIMTIDAEAVAFQWLQQHRVTYAQLMQMLDLLPASPTTRHISEHIDNRAPQKAIHFGAFVHGPLTGIRVTTPRYPWVCRLLNCIVNTLAADTLHTNVFLSLNVPMGLHADINNMAGIANTLIPLSRFEGGQLYVCDPEGGHKLEAGGMKGNVVPITLPFSRFNPHRKHLVLPWRGPTSYWARIIYVMLVCFLAPIESFLQSWVATSARGSLRLIRT